MFDEIESLLKDPKLSDALFKKLEKKSGVNESEELSVASVNSLFVKG